MNNVTYNSTPSVIVIPPVLNIYRNATCTINGVSTVTSAAHVRVNEDSSIDVKPLTPLLVSIITEAVNSGETSSTVVSNNNSYHLNTLVQLVQP